MRIVYIAIDMSGDPVLYAGALPARIQFSHMPDDGVTWVTWDFAAGEWGPNAAARFAEMIKVGNHYEYDWDGGANGDIIRCVCRVVEETEVLIDQFTFENVVTEAGAEPGSLIIEEIAQYLHAEGLGIFDPSGAGGDIFIEDMPDTPDEAIGLYSTGGLAPDVSTNVARPTVQIIVRGTRDPRVASVKALAIYGALHGLHSALFVAGETRIMLCSARQSEPIALGRDENGRHEYSINLLLITGGD